MAGELYFHSWVAARRIMDVFTPLWEHGRGFIHLGAISSYDWPCFDHCRPFHLLLLD